MSDSENEEKKLVPIVVSDDCKLHRVFMVEEPGHLIWLCIPEDVWNAEFAEGHFAALPNFIRPQITTSASSPNRHHLM